MLQKEDFNTLYSANCTKAAYNRQRLNECLQSKESAEARLQRRQEGHSKVHVSQNFSAVCLDWEALVTEAKTWQPGKKINWQSVARRYAVHQVNNTSVLAKNGGQVVQNILKHHGIDVTQFITGTGQKTGTPQLRRSAKRLKSGIAIPQRTSGGSWRRKKKNYTRKECW